MKLIKEFHPEIKEKKMGPRSEEIKNAISKKLTGIKRPPRTRAHINKLIESRKKHNDNIVYN